MSAGIVDTVRLRARRRASIVGISAMIALVVVAAVTLTTGDYPMAVSRVWATLWGGGERVEQYVIFQVRAVAGA